MCTGKKQNRAAERRSASIAQVRFDGIRVVIGDVDVDSSDCGSFDDCIRT
jgi:hypothetical protein